MGSGFLRDKIKLLKSILPQCNMEGSRMRILLYLYVSRYIYI